jgi:hypothetical protein
MIVAVARNDPCPCGSGKKYKKCHGAGSIQHEHADPASRRASTLKTVDRELGDQLLRFARTRFGRDWFLDVSDLYTGIEDGQVMDIEMQIAIPWMLHFAPHDPGGISVSAHWLRERGSRVTEDQNLVLNAYANAWVSIWEVQEVRRGTGTRLRDILTNEERLVYDVSSAETLRRFDSALAIVLDCGNVSFFGGVHGSPLPPNEASNVVSQAKRWCRVRTRPVAKHRLRDPGLQLDLIAMWNDAVDVMRSRPMPTLTNTDGDPFALTTDCYELLAHEDEAARRIERLNGVTASEADGEDLVFTATEPDNAMHRSWDNTIIGTLRLSAHELRVETNSIRRADSLRHRLEAELAGMIRFRMRSEANTETMIREASQRTSRREPRATEAMPAEMVEAVRSFREQHMRAWLDDSIPALGDLTPREASRTAKGRRALETLLKEFQQTEDAHPADERIDLGFVRDELGLRRL